MNRRAMLSDEQLKRIDAKEFRKSTGITKTDYRFLRSLILRGIDPKSVTIWKPGGDDKPLTLHQFCQEFRDIDVIYITRIQKERA